MGGGDLNLKKSWHPSTLRNIERVWKAEQKHEVEKQKIEQLQKELADERAREEIQTFAEDQGVVRKKEERLDWMYQGPAAMLNRDEFLLGKKIDKTFETHQQRENGSGPSREEDAEIGSTMFSSQDLTGTATVDLANKIREDPLFNIMKKEKEERKNLLTNPVKVKQLQQMLKASLKNPKSKKSKKNKKKKHHDSDSDEEKQEKKNKKKKYHKSDTSEDSENERTPYRQQKMSSKDILSYKRNEKYEDDTPPPSERRHRDYYSSSDNMESTHRSSHYRERISISNHRESNHYSYRESSHQSYRESSTRESAQESRYQSSYHKDHNSYKTYSHKSQDNHREDRSSKSDNKKKLDSGERERLLKEMQDNAKWREDQRKRNTQRYREEEQREEQYQRIDTSDFLKPMLAKAAGKVNLESRVKQKIFTLQRSSGAMDKNFARRE